MAYDKYVYVDVHWEDPNTGRRAQKWKRTHVDDVTAFQQENSNYNVFATVQRFKNPTHTTPELSYMPFYFDLDSSLGVAKLLEEGTLTLDAIQEYLSPEEQAHVRNFVDVGIPLEKGMIKQLDEKLKIPIWDSNLSRSMADAKKIVLFFTQDLGLTEEDVRLFFSGKKGFHIIVSPVALGIEPRLDLNLIYKFVALYLQQKLGLKTLDYGSIYSSRRMLRLVDSVHQSSRLFKIEMYHKELELPPTEVRSLAKSPRGILHKELTEQLNDTAFRWFASRVEDWQDSENTKNQKAVIATSTLADMDTYPTCVQDILDNGIKKSGDRNKATMALASYFKDIGTKQGETERILSEWVVKIPKELTSADITARKASTITAVRTIYGDDKYHFGCAFIRSLHGERRGGDYASVPCAGRTCPIHEDHQIDLEPAVKMHLSDTAKAEYTGKKVAFDCLVSGKLDTPYIVPKKVRYMCFSEDACDKECVMHDYAGVMEREFAENERVLIEATHQNDNNLKGILRQYSGASCKKLALEVTDYSNVEELLVVPMAERVTIGKNEAGETVDMDELGREYVARKVYYVGGKIIPNQYYEFEGYVYPHPKNQFGTVLSQKYTPKQDNVSSFQLTDELKNLFTVFQVQQGETVMDRLDLLLDDLTQNVTKIWQRDEVVLGMLLTYHSVLSFHFQEQQVKRGWLETILVGDSGCGKTQIVQNFTEFVGLGELASGESASRTGLIYRLEQIGDRWFITWGKYPLNDRKLLVIDELTGLAEDDLGTMTESRSTGVLKVDRAVNAETNARTRLLFMSNPRYGKQLFEFTHGIETLKGIFKEASDIRRLDLALFLATKDVPKSVLNRKYTKPDRQLISHEAIKNSILWAWSRKPEDVVLTEAALDLILKTAGYLGDKYGSAEDIPLVSPADQRIKLARLCVALACLIHSTDSTHEKVIVLPEHVDFIRDYLEMVYDAKNCRYDAYAMNAKDEGELAPEEKTAVDTALNKLDTEDAVPVSQDILELFRRNDTLKSQELQDMTGYSRELVNPRLAVLAKYNFVKRTRNGFRKLPKFIEYLEQSN